MEKVGIFLSRMQPVHNAHLWIIEKAVMENDRVLIIIGSANKVGTVRNPIDIKIRRRLVEKSLVEKFGENYTDKISIVELPDWSTENNNDDQEWGRLIYYNVVSAMDVKTFSYYCSEEPQKIEGWFEDILKSRIDFKYFSRINGFNGLSATKVRQAILEDNDEYIEKYCPKCVLEHKNELKDIIKFAKTIE